VPLVVNFVFREVVVLKVMVIGSGGREHILAWKLARSPLVDKLYAAPGNPGIWEIAARARIDVDNPRAFADFAEAERIGLTVVGPENYLAQGLVDIFQDRGLRIFGPTMAAAEIETDKSFAKEFMARHAIPTAGFAAFDDLEPARAYLAEHGAPIVIKACGLAAGKGVFVCLDTAEAEHALTEIMAHRIFGAAGDRIIFEAYLEGEEASLLVLTDGDAALPLLVSQDHKRIGDGDRGANTGGMGAYAPASVLAPGELDKVMSMIVRPTIAGLAAEGRPYRGVLYVGLMMTAAGPKVIEYNCRFGDPEAQAVLPLLITDLASLCLACSEGDLGSHQLTWLPGSAVCVVIASGGYPGNYTKGLPIEGLDTAAASPGAIVLHAGTALRDGGVVTNGGRVLNIVGVGDDVATSRRLAYQAVERIGFPGMHYRKDIAWREMERT